MLNWETTINNRLSDSAKQRLAEALERRRYVLFIGSLDPADGRLYWYLNQPEHASNRFNDADLEGSVFHLAELILQGRKSQIREATNAVSDVGE